MELFSKAQQGYYSFLEHNDEVLKRFEKGYFDSDDISYFKQNGIAFIFETVEHRNYRLNH